MDPKTNIDKMPFVLFVIAGLLLCPVVVGAETYPPAGEVQGRYEKAEPPCMCWADFSLQTVFRSDRLNWHIAGRNVNILSELIVDDLEIFQIKATGAFTKRNYTFFAEAAHGEIFSGTNVDRDFLANNRGNLFSESVARVSGRDATDFSGGIGRNIDLDAGRYRLTPMVGASWSRLRLLKTRGVQTVATPGTTPPTGPFPGLASTYDAQWTGVWTGAGIRVRTASALTIAASFRYQFFDYRADADWNLRQDLSHPVSFTHRANGRGFEGDMAYKWAITERMDISLTFLYKYLLAKNGTDTTYFASGNRAKTPLNRVSWRSRAVMAGLSYRF